MKQHPQPPCGLAAVSGRMLSQQCTRGFTRSRVAQRSGRGRDVQSRTGGSEDDLPNRTRHPEVEFASYPTSTSISTGTSISTSASISISASISTSTSISISTGELAG